MSSENLFNKVINNYLISGNGSKRANAAVYALYDLVKDNTPFAIYVAGFILSSLWIILLATYYLFTNNTNSYISKNLIEKYKFDEGQKNEKEK